MKLLPSLLIFTFLACTSTKPLNTRGLSEKERGFYIIQHGYNLSQKIKDHFRKGIACEGMHSELIFSLFGVADFISEAQKFNPNTGEPTESKWSYLKIKKKEGWELNTIVEFIFDENDIVIQIIGDRCGGLPDCEEIINSLHGN
jgi:hypothetical protein